MHKHAVLRGEQSLEAFWRLGRLARKILQGCPFCVQVGKAISYELTFKHLESVSCFILISLPAKISILQLGSMQAIYYNVG